MVTGFDRVLRGKGERRYSVAGERVVGGEIVPRGGPDSSLHAAAFFGNELFLDFFNQLQLPRQAPGDFSLLPSPSSALRFSRVHPCMCFPAYGHVGA